MVALPVDFSALTGTIQASQFDQNFVALNSKFGQLTSADLSSAAGITVTQLAAQYAFKDVVFDLLDFGYTTASLNGRTAWTVDMASTLWCRRRVTANPGQIVYLCLVEIFAEAVNASSPYPQVIVYKNGSALPGMSFTLDTSNSFFIVGNASPKTAPLYPFVDGDVISYYLGYSSAGSPTSRRIQVREHWKEQLGV